VEFVDVVKDLHGVVVYIVAYEAGGYFVEGMVWTLKLVFDEDKQLVDSGLHLIDGWSGESDFFGDQWQTIRSFHCIFVGRSC
jgi:hypothetical protein